ncbi:MAG TPA: class III signal peptide-containing protein [archaeon]|nr:class III signal peptide-containing protein [archaeon]
MIEKKGQGAIEYLLIIGAAILVVAVVIIALTGVLTTGQESTDKNNVDTIKDPLSGLLGVRLEEGKSYQMDLSIPEETSLDIIFPKAGNGTTLRYKKGKTSYTHIKGQESWTNKKLLGIIKATIIPIGSFKINTEVVQVSELIEEGILEITDFKYYGRNNSDTTATDKILDDTINVIIKNKFNENVQITTVKFNETQLINTINWQGVLFFKNYSQLGSTEVILAPNEQVLLSLQPRNNPRFELNKSVGQNVTITLAFDYSKSGTSSTTYTKTLTTTIKDIEVFDGSTYYE